MRRILKLLLVIFLIALPLQGEAGSIKITLPTDNDDYSKLVASAYAGDKSVNYRALRLAWYTSAAYKRSLKTKLDDIRRDLASASKEHDETKTRLLAQQLVSINFADLIGHKYLRESCESLGDQDCASLHRSIEFGLLGAILMAGDGQTCSKAWEVVSQDEEVLILQTTGMKLSRDEEMTDSGRKCDRMEVTNNTGKHVIYFALGATSQPTKLERPVKPRFRVPHDQPQSASPSDTKGAATNESATPSPQP